MLDLKGGQPDESRTLNEGVVQPAGHR
jgi:hypothetical protein